MEPDDDAGNGDGLTVDQAASAFAKTLGNGAEKATPEPVDDAEAIKADELQASDQDEADEGNPDDEGQANEDEAEPESEEGRFVATNGKVRLPDGTVSTVAELISGNMRDRDYRQKTMSLKDERRAFEEQSLAVTASQKQVTEERAYLATLLQAILPPQPDISMMQSDPLGYMEQKERHEQFVRQLGWLQQRQAMSAKEAEEKVNRDREGIRESARAALVEAIPALRDQAKMKAFGDEIQSVGEGYGFTFSEMLEQIPYDHRMALVLRDAGKWRQLQASKHAVQDRVQGRPPVQRAGKREAPDARRAQTATDAMSRLRASGSVEDAARAWIASQKG